MKKNPALLAYAFAYLAFLYLPVLFLPLFSFNASQIIAFPLTGFTTHWYEGLFADSAMQQALGNSLEVGAIAALLSTLLGLMAAKAVTGYRLRGTAAALGFISLPLFIPDIVLGISLLLLLGVLDVPLALGTVVLG
jgi:spermidine/putrescine transport system permease protein